MAHGRLNAHLPIGGERSCLRLPGVSPRGCLPIGDGWSIEWPRRGLGACLLDGERSCCRGRKFPGICGRRPVGGWGVRDRGEKFLGGGVGDGERGGSQGAGVGDGGFGHSQAIAAFVAEGVYQEVLGQPGCWTQYEFV